MTDTRQAAATPASDTERKLREALSRVEDYFELSRVAYQAKYGIQPAFANIISIIHDALALPAGQDGWLPIESAPKDETVVLLHCPDSWDSDHVRVGWWFASENDDSGWYDDEVASAPLTDFYGEPTHWHPLPAPPASGGER